MAGESAFAEVSAGWQLISGGRYQRLSVAPGGQPGFTLVQAEESGIHFTNYLSKTCYTTNQTFLNGSGVALADVDGDGLCDIYAGSLQGPNALYRNLGNWRFANVTVEAGVARSNFAGTSSAFADVDGDGDLDLILSSIGQGTSILFNDGHGHFAPSGQPPLNLNRAAMSMALADIDGDGDLDLYVANYRMISIRDQPNTRFRVSTASGKPVVTQVNGRPVTDPDLVGRFELDPNGKVIEHGEPPALYLNDGQGHFTAVSFTDGRFLDEDGKPLTQPLYDWGLSVAFRDLNGDGAPDIYACNDFNSPDRIWLNDGTGRFRAIARVAIRTTPLFSMGMDFADVNRDGFEDIYVVDMVSRDHRKRHNQLPDILPPVSAIGDIENRPQYSRNVLLLNRGDTTFAEIGQWSGLYASEWSWSPVFLDVDLDGYEDILVVTGNERDSMNADLTRTLNSEIARTKMSGPQILEMKNRFARLELPNLAFRNRGDLTFEEAGAAWGFNTIGVSQGMALADLDNDGDLDAVVNNLNGPLGLYRNNAPGARLLVRLSGRPGNTQGIGARIRVRGGPVRQSQEIMGAGRYLSCDAACRAFAGGASSNRLTVEVTWRSGVRTTVEKVPANSLLEVQEAAGTNAARHVAAAPAASEQPLFEEVSGRIAHRHHDEPYNDFERQTLLQRKLSQLGPGVAWYDIDGDGWEDLIVGTGAGGRLAVYLNDHAGGFKPLDTSFTPPATRDTAGVLGWRSPAGQVTVLAGSANYEDGLADGPAALLYDLRGRRVDNRIPGQVSSTGPMALADVDGRGGWAWFVGGRVNPGRYPEPASSMLLRWRETGWELDAANTRVLRNLGLASGALWSDLDGDGTPELVVACEAGPLRVFALHDGLLTERTQSLGLLDYRGLWNAIAAGDFDEDGRLDLLATNWGGNQRYANPGGGEVRLCYGDFLGNGRLEVIEAYHNRAMSKLVPFAGLESMARALPFVRERVRGHEAYGAAGLEELLGERAKSATILSVNTLSSMVFLNRGDHFEAQPLPEEAQRAPAFGVSVADFDGDGHEDAFLSQNFFAMQPEIPRMDAGRGLLLKGDGLGHFTPVPGQVSGLRIYGEQRGCAAADFDQDGRVDLVVAQNGAATKLFRNRKANPGLRIRLVGGAGNPDAVGAVIRMESRGGIGPAREIHAGSGYWSQDGLVQVMSAKEPPWQVVVRWPGGETTRHPIPEGARAITIERPEKRGEP